MSLINSKSWYIAKKNFIEKMKQWQSMFWTVGFPILMLFVYKLVFESDGYLNDGEGYSPGSGGGKGGRGSLSSLGSLGFISCLLSVVRCLLLVVCPYQISAMFSFSNPHSAFRMTP